MAKAENFSHLRELGFDSAAPAAQAIAQLKALRAAGAGDEEIAHALGAIIAPEAAAMLAAMETGATGSRRREIRRALFRLKQHGLEPPTSESQSALPEMPSDAGLSALLSATDAIGARIVWLMRTRSSGGLRRLWALVSESDGLVSVNLEAITRKQYRSERAEVERRAGTQLVAADPKLADFILCDAFRHTSDDRRGRIGDFLLLRSEIIGEAPPRAIEHPVYREFARQLQNDPAPDLLQAPEVGAYKLPANAVKSFADEIAGLRDSVIVLSRMQQQERANLVVERALDDLIKGETADRLRRHLEDAAYVLARRGKREEAASAAAAAARIRDGADLKRVAFFQAFMRAQLGAIIAEQREEKSEEPRLIMTPAEAMRARQAAQARMRGR